MIDLIANAYPKSGLTWLIHLLSDTFDLVQQNIASDEIQGCWGDSGDNGYVRKKHEPNAGQYLSSQKIVHLQRDPRDMLISAMYYRNHNFDDALTYLINPLEHYIGGFWTYEDYLDSWLKSDYLITRYEWLHCKPFEELSRIAAYLDCNVSDDKIQLAIERQSFGNMSAIIDDPHFMRKGIVGDWRNHFNREQGRKFNDVLGGFMLRQGYIDSLDWWKQL